MILRDANDLSQVSEVAKKVQRERTRDYESHQRENISDAFQAGAELLDLFELLPAAMLESERAEYERLAAEYGKSDPRTLSVAENLAELEQVELHAARGRVRARRAMETMQEASPSLSGFVTDEQGNALDGYTVRLSPAGRAKPLQAKAAKDGFFRVPFAVDPQDASSSKPVTIQILDRRGSVVHSDPLQISPNEGSVYREYQLEAAAAPASDTSRKRKK